MSGILILIALTAFGAVMILLNVALRSSRLRMVELAEEMLADPAMGHEDRELIDHLIDTAFSFRVAFLAIPAALAAMFEIILGEAWERDALDPRFGELTSRYVASVSAVNPIGAIIAAPIVLTAGIFAGLFGKQSMPVAMERQAIRASRAVA